MASRRLLKKDIDNLIDDLVMDCYLSMYEQTDKDLSGFESLINDAIALREDLFTRINHADESGENKNVFYRKLKKDLTVALTNSYQKLNSLNG